MTGNARSAEDRRLVLSISDLTGTELLALMA